MLRTLASLALAASVLGCKPAPPPIDRPSDQQQDDGPTPSDEHAAQEGDAGEDHQDDHRLPGPELPSGPLCDSDVDCGEGMVCEGVGCEPGQGRCVSTDRICTRDLAQYCGCDGQLFQSSGTCPGRRYAYRGPCDPQLEDGEPCTDGRQCQSGQCVGEGLEGCSPGDQGVCGQAACTRDLVTYCSCNNTEFQASGTCPNRQFAYRGPCEG
ncbi:MAG: hypothetical protein R6X02_02640 [Enhygromyxa sp.]